MSTVTKIQVALTATEKRNAYATTGELSDDELQNIGVTWNDSLSFLEPLTN